METQLNVEGKQLIQAALVKAQAQMMPATLDKVNPHLKNRYASLASIVAAIKGPLSGNGISYYHYFDNEEKALVTELAHISGQTLQCKVPMIMQKNDMQGLGSAVTYAKRIGLSCLTGCVADEDDDANAVSNVGGNKNEQPKKPATGPIPKLIERPSAEQKKELVLLAHKAMMEPESVKDLMKELCGKTDSSELTMEEYKELKSHLEQLARMV